MNIFVSLNIRIEVETMLREFLKGISILPFYVTVKFAKKHSIIFMTVQILNNGSRYPFSKIIKRGLCKTR